MCVANLCVLSALCHVERNELVKSSNFVILFRFPERMRFVMTTKSAKLGFIFN